MMPTFMMKGRQVVMIHADFWGRKWLKFNAPKWLEENMWVGKSMFFYQNRGFDKKWARLFEKCENFKAWVIHEHTFMTFCQETRVSTSFDALLLLLVCKSTFNYKVSFFKQHFHHFLKILISGPEISLKSF